MTSKEINLIIKEVHSGFYFRNYYLFLNANVDNIMFDDMILFDFTYDEVLEVARKCYERYKKSICKKY